ncbi:MAG TPA: glycosyltransferase [Humisphaera sp.]
MAHLGFLCPELSGHLHPMMSLARAAQRRGHAVTFYQRPYSCPRVSAAGFACRAYGEREFPVPVFKAHLARLAGLSGRPALAYTARLFDLQARALMRDVPPMLRADRVDLLVVDQALGAGSTVAALAGLPFAVVCNALALDAEPGVPPFCVDWAYRPGWVGRARNRVGYGLLRTAAAPVFRSMNAVRRRRGLPEIRDFAGLAGGAQAVVCQQPKEFDFPRAALPPAFRYVGPMVEPDVRPPAPFPWDRLDPGRPLIYASMGTLQNGVRKTFGTIAAACDRLGAQLVISLGGGGDPAALGKLPGDPVVVGFAPQLDLIRRAALVVTHAGLNTALECLSAGVPMVAIPVTNDQPGVAARIRHVGAGEFVPLRSLDVASLRDRVKRVMREGRYRDAARKMRDAIGQCGGAEEGARVLEGAVG